MGGKLATNPQTRDYLQQPDFVTKMQELQKDSSKLGQYMSDPRIMQVMGMLMGVDVMSGDQFKEKMDQDEPMAEAKPAPTPAPKPEPVPEPEPEPVAVDPSKEKADALKAEGNAHYKKFNETEKAIKKRDEEAYLDDDKAEEGGRRAMTPSSGRTILRRSSPTPTR